MKSGRTLARSCGAFCAVALLFFCGTAAAQYNEEEAQLYWDELPALLLKQTIELTLPDSTRVKGSVLSIGDDGLLLDVKETSNPAGVPARPLEVPRSSIESLTWHTERLSGSGGVFGKVVGALAVPITYAFALRGPRGVVAVTGILVGGAALGEYLATRPEKTMIRIRIRNASS